MYSYIHFSFQNSDVFNKSVDLTMSTQLNNSTGGKKNYLYSQICISILLYAKRPHLQYEHCLSDVIPKTERYLLKNFFNISIQKQDISVNFKQKILYLFFFYF